MLFLAGLLGIATMGAVAFTGFHAPTEEDDTSPGTHGPDHQGPEPSEGSDGLVRMLDHAASGPTGDTASTAHAGHDGEIISGTDTADVICGSAGPDQINGYASEDTIDGADGADILHGGDGGDVLLGSGGNDTLHGDGGHDILRGGTGQDELFGHNGRDVMFGDEGDDTLHGGDGQDEAHGGAGDDVLHGGLDNDRLFGGLGADTLFGGWGDDTLSGYDEDHITAMARLTEEADFLDVNFLNGGGGDDVILAGPRDIVTGGSGADRIVIGDWIKQGHEAHILDFAPDEDALVVIFDDMVNPTPAVSIGADPENPDDRLIVLNGVPVATVANAPGLTLDHIALLPHASLTGLMGT